LKPIIQFLTQLPLQPSTIEAQSALSASLLSQTLRSTSVNPLSANPLKPITSESADASDKITDTRRRQPLWLATWCHQGILLIL
jgi:hypothetical protein